MGKKHFNKNYERYKAAVEARRHEIDLFWRRSLFFWGFIVAAFGAYISLLSEDTYEQLRLLLAGFGLVCALVWSLANRGSKYWQENWEKKVNESEIEVTGKLYAIQSEPEKKGLFSAQRYSVSKLAILLSDLICVIWLGLFIHHAIHAVKLLGWQAIEDSFVLFLILLPIFFVVLAFLHGRSSKSHINEEH